MWTLPDPHADAHNFLRILIKLKELHFFYLFLAGKEDGLFAVNWLVLRIQKRKIKIFGSE